MISPSNALLVFFFIALVLFWIFRPNKGLYWVSRKSQQSSEKILIEDILKSLFHSENDHKELKLGDFYKQLNTNPQILKEILKKMVLSGLVKEQNGKYILLQPGLDYALKIIRVHRLYEKYLSEKTGFDQMEWHARAEEMEHKLDSSDTQLLADELGNPRFDPHGDPIPTEDGELVQVKGISLARASKNMLAKIIHIEDEPPEVYRQILEKNIHIGSQIQIVDIRDNSIQFFSEGNNYHISLDVAANITVSADTKIVNQNAVRLSSLKLGEQAKVFLISRESRGDARRRLLDLGFVRDAQIQVDLTSPFGDPTAYLIKGTTIAIRKSQADNILIIKEK